MVSGLVEWWRYAGPGFLALASAACEAHDRVLPFLGALDAALDAGAPVAEAGTPDAQIASDAAQPAVDAGTLDAGGEAGVIARPADPECDMTGLWMVKQITRSEALALGQFANYWYFFELRQDGETVSVVRQLDCDIRVEGSVTVTLTAATRRALMAHNTQTSRKGTMRRAGDRCELTFERFWSIRGAEEARFAPTPRSSTDTVSALRQSTPLPTTSAPDGAEDWENDGQLGIAWQITGIASGTRNTVQRDVTEWFTDDTHTITPALDFRDRLVLRSRFDNDENVMHASSSLVGSLATADQTAEHRVTFAFLGRSADDARARAVLDADDLVTCDHVVDGIPAENAL